MSEQFDPRQQTPHARIQRIFGLAHEAANHLQDIDPITLDPNSYKDSHSHARVRMNDFAGRVALWQHHWRKPIPGNVGGLHAVHPDAGFTGTFYHGRRPDSLSFDLVTLHGNDSRGRFFTAEELSVRKYPTAVSSNDISLRRISHGTLKLQPISIAIDIGMLSVVEDRFTAYLAEPDTADTTRVLITSAPVDPDQ